MHVLVYIDYLLFSRVT